MSYYNRPSEDNQLAAIATAWLVAFAYLAYIVLKAI